jgi:hypothetical protein
MKSTIFLIISAAVCCAPADRIPGRDPSKLQVLVLTGYNSTPNHDWRAYVPELRRILERSGRFEVRVVEEPAGMTRDTLAGYDVLLLDYSNYIAARGRDWPEVTRRAYLEFLENGGGTVALHAACGSFQAWPEYRRSLGIADQRTIGHGPYHTFAVEVRAPDHPALGGLPERFNVWGEIYNGITLTSDAEVLAVAYDNPANCTAPGRNCGSGKREPVLWTARYGKGRSFVLTLGHDLKSIRSPEFARLLAQASEWAAGALP